jgi:hypothetical protein
MIFMKNLKALYILPVIILFMFSCMPVKKAYIRYQYRNDFWVKNPEVKMDKNSSATLVHSPEGNPEDEVVPDKGITDVASSSVEKPVNQKIQDKKNSVISDSESPVKTFQEKEMTKNDNSLSYTGLKSLLKKEQKKSPAGDLVIQESRPFPVYGLISVISGGLSVISALWAPFLAFSLVIPEIMIIYFVFFAAAVACGVISLVKKEKKRGLAIAGLAAAGLSLFIFGIINGFLAAFGGGWNLI